MPHVGRLVPLDLADRLRRQVGRVGLDENAIVRHGRRDGPQLVRLLVRHHAGEADVEAHRQALLGHRPAAGERVHHAGERPAGVRLAEHHQDVVVAIAHVDDERQAALCDEPQVPIEIVLLHVERREVPVAIEARLADRHDARLAGQRDDPVPIARLASAM